MKEFKRLIGIMKKLRDPSDGCPWDLRQTETSLREYIIEEAYELVEAIDQSSPEHQLEELGDLLLQIVFLSRINQEKSNFDIRDVISRINRKLISRHPHIFSNIRVNSASEVKNNWEKIKKQEKKRSSIISDYPKTMPALMAAKRIAEQAASVGFDWQNESPGRTAALQALEKAEEEIRELKSAIISETRRPQSSQQQINEETGDLLFAVANVARILDISPEFALKEANQKFKKRFRYIESRLKAEGKDIQKTSLEEMEILWQESKKN
jgi:MazG family protein